MMNKIFSSRSYSSGSSTENYEQIELNQLPSQQRFFGSDGRKNCVVVMNERGNVSVELAGSSTELAAGSSTELAAGSSRSEEIRILNRQHHVESEENSVSEPDIINPPSGSEDSNSSANINMDNNPGSCNGSPRFKRKKCIILRGNRGDYNRCDLASPDDYEDPEEQDPETNGFAILWTALKIIFFAIFIVFSLYALFCTATYTFTKKERELCLSYPCIKTASYLLNGMNQSADPCEDFFEYACGMWNDVHLIPEDKSSISTFEVLADNLHVVLRRILSRPIDAKDNDATKKAKTFFGSCMKARVAEKETEQQISQLVEYLGGWPVVDRNWSANQYDLELLLGRVKHAFYLSIVIDSWVGSDDQNSSVNVIQLDQMSVGLPNRDYFLKPNGTTTINAYRQYMVDVAVKMGAETSTAIDEFQQVIEFETKLAQICTDEADRQDTSLMYTKMGLEELMSTVPEIRWEVYFSTFIDVDLYPDEPIVIYALSYYKKLGKLLSETNPRTVQNYVIWRLLMDIIIPIMTDELQNMQLQFKKVILGVSSERDRWSQCVDWTNQKMGTAVGALFVSENFDAKSKDSAIEVIKEIREAFNELLDENEWMDEETKIVAKEKANAMNQRIGYPDILTNVTYLEQEYKEVEVTEHNFFQNMLNIMRHSVKANVGILRSPVVKEQWTSDPAVVNAFYNPNKNDIVFPAGILQPFFYSMHFPKSINFGGIGVVIGHEITHGFDEKGRQFDKDGNLKQWWNNATIKAFKEKTQCIVDQYSAYEIEEVQMNLNGKITQGENIADNGGLKQAFRAFQNYKAKHGEEPYLPGIDLNHEQLFFLNYAQIWCGATRREEIIAKIGSAPHSPGKFRVLGPLSNSKDFAKAYNCPLGSKMNPFNKCSVW